MTDLDPETQAAMREIYDNAFSNTAAILGPLPAPLGLGICGAEIKVASDGEIEQRKEALQGHPLEYTPGCRKGCSLCCRVIGVTIASTDALSLALYLEKTRTPEELASLKVRIRAEAAFARQCGSITERYKHDRPCALLGEDDACTVYDARPLPCRTHVGKSGQDCEDDKS